MKPLEEFLQKIQSPTYKVYEIETVLIIIFFRDTKVNIVLFNKNLFYVFRKDNFICIPIRRNLNDTHF